MKKIQVMDTTFTECRSLAFKEKVILIRQLAALGVDGIELGTLTDAEEDKLFIKTVAPFVSGTVLAACAGKSAAEAAAAWSALSPLPHKRLIVEYPTSVVQMEYFCHAKPERVLEMLTEQVAAAAALTGEVEFSAVDATRSELDFLARAVSAAIDAGARYITLCDSEGAVVPTELSAFLAAFLAACPKAAALPLYVKCCDKLSMSAANSTAAIAKEASGVKTTLCGSGSVRLAALMHLISQRGNDFGLSVGVDATGIHRAEDSMPWLNGEKREGSATAVEEAGDTDEILLAKGTTVRQLSDVIAHLGYELTQDDVAKVFSAFDKLAERKTVSGRELETIIADVAQEVPPTYILRSYIVNSGDRMTPMAQVEIEKDGEVRHGVSIGDGPIDAAILAVERVIGTHYELDDFRISSVTRGQEAMGEALVRLRSRGRVFSGGGVSTDIIGAALKAYVSALNKIVFEER